MRTEEEDDPWDLEYDDAVNEVIDLRQYTAEMEEKIAELNAQLADMTRRKDGWRTLMRATYRAYMSEMCGSEVEGSDDHYRFFDAMNDGIREQLLKMRRGVSMWGVLREEL